jgi:hypothetical protein
MIHIACHNEYLLDKYWDFKKTGSILHMELLNNMGNHLREHQQIVAQQQEMQFQKELYAQMLLKKATPEQIILSKRQPNNNPKSKKGQ